MKDSDILDRKKMILAMDYINASFTLDKSDNDGENNNFNTDYISNDDPTLKDDAFSKRMDDFLTNMSKIYELEGLCFTSNLLEKKKMIVAMEYVARQINDEDIFWGIWASVGVPDGDIEYGNFDLDQIYDEDCMLYKENFEELVDAFLRCMVQAIKSGGLYCGNISTNLG